VQRSVIQAHYAMKICGNRSGLSVCWCV